MLALALVALLAVVLRPAPAPEPVGSWMARAGLVPRYEDVGGLSVRYVRAGEGPPVVLLHGIASSLYTWKDVLPALARSHDVIAPDLPGFGGSAVPEAASGEGTVRTVSGLMDRLEIARASLVGNSLGGAIALALAARHPERVDRLVLIDAAGYNFEPGDRPWVLRLAGSVPEPVVEALPVVPVVRLALVQVFHDDSLVTPQRVAEYAAPLGRPGAMAAVRRLLHSGDDLGFPAVIRAVRAPTLVVWGRHDTWIPARDAERFAADIPGARVEVLETGHLPQEERPAETARLIRGFLATSPGPSASRGPWGPRRCWGTPGAGG